MSPTANDLVDSLDAAMGTQFDLPFRELRPDPIPARRRNHPEPPARICLIPIKSQLDTGAPQPKRTVDLSPSDLSQGRARLKAKRRAKSRPFN
ncbi:hypothetical protein [Thiocystis violacea]|uniref:hypothetical protein n=1 Tax=Thiocystis violacea TaxID=13725 RepID=UPI001905B611|nr:hypothetical protein [Thiocystis violacea]MBK1719191.1 hypothetical protein [Thiocystis violacea]